MRSIFKYLGVSIAMILCAGSICGAEPLGIFEDSVDVGEPANPGIAIFSDGIYTVDAVGATIGRQALSDQFHFVYKKIRGSFAIQAEPQLLDVVGRGGLMIRQTLDADSVHASLLITTDAAKEGSEALEGSVYPLFRTLKGGGTKGQGDPEPGGFTNSHTGTLRLERVGNSIFFYTFNNKGNKVLIRTEIVPMPDEVLVGLAATAENDAGYGSFGFDKVVIEEYPLMVTRKLPVAAMQPGTTLSPITLTASVRSGKTADTTITEVIPPGTTLSNVKVTAGTFSILADGNISWILTGLSGDAALTYDLKLVQDASISFQGTFTDGIHAKSYLGGDAVLPSTYAFPTTANPVIIDPSFTTVIQMERGIPANETGWALMLDPRTLSGITAVSVDTSANSTLEFPFTILQAGTYYIFANVRGDDGNSDSFHFELDFPPAGDEATTWDITGDKKYSLDWVNRRTPAEDPRPFEMSQGDHSLFIGNRENDASIDWLAITTVKNLNLTKFNERVPSIIATRVMPSLQGAIPASITVKLNLHVRSGSSIDTVIEETPPSDWTITGNPVGTGQTQIQDGKILWTIPKAQNDVTLTYDIAPKSGDRIGFFTGKATDQSYNYTLDVTGSTYYPTTLNYELAAKPFDIGAGTVILQAESPSAFSGQMAIQPDATLPSKLYVIAQSAGVNLGKTTDQELTFTLNVLSAGTYYLFANCRGENSLSDSFYVGWDVNFVDLPESDDYGYLISGNKTFERRWFQTYTSGGRFWDVTGKPRPFTLSAGLHKLSWHSRVPNAKVDWIGITQDPNLDIAAVNETGQNPPGVDGYMLY